MKPKLRLHDENAPDAPGPLKFPGQKVGGPTCPAFRETVEGVEQAIEDAQKRLDRLRDLVFKQDDPKDDGPRAA